MTNKSFYKMRNRRKSNHALLVRIFVVAVLAASALALATLPSHAGSTALPQWMRTAAQQNLPEYPKETVAVALYDEQITVAKENGDIQTTRRYACKILRPEGRDQCGFAVFPYDTQTKITSLHAWTLLASGADMEVKESDEAEASAISFEMFNDERVKVLKFPESNVGNVTGYEFTQVKRPYVYEDGWFFQDKIPTKFSRFSLSLPAGWEYTSFWSNYDEQKPISSSGNQYVWEVHDIPGVEREPAMPAFPAVAARVRFKYYPSNPALRAKSSGTWDDIAAWYSSLTVNSRNPSPALQQKVSELTAGVTDPLRQMKILTEYMQQNIRYVAIEIGIGGWQPHPAAEVFAHQYGDCKDKATLLSTMLKQVGIDSYYVPIFTYRGIVNPKFPSIHFNHVILAIKLPDSMPDSGLFSVMKTEHAGRIMFFDPTNDVVPLGYLPYYLQDNYGLVITPTGGDMVSLPLAAPVTNRLLRTATLNLAPTGSLTGEVRELRFGGPAEMERHELADVKPVDRDKVVEKFLGQSLSSFTLDKASIGSLDKIDESLLVTYKFTSDGYAKNAGDLLILRPRVVGEHAQNFSNGKPRKYPIEFRESTRQDDVFDITLPPGYVVDELPKPVQAQCPYASYKSEVVVNGNVLRYKRTYEVTDILVPTEHAEELRDFFHQIAADEKASAVLKRSNP
jgi:transglutaminase-like putative cysteine protease